MKWSEHNYGDYTDMSLPTRERGLKFIFCGRKLEIALVAPHAGAWIEIVPYDEWTEFEEVAPHAGAWIEIFFDIYAVCNACGRSPRGSVD